MGERRDAVRTGNHSQSKMTTQISKKRKFVADGVFYAELNEMLTRELAEDGYAGVDVRVTPLRTEIIIKATRTQQVLGEKGRRIRELASVVQKRFNFAEGLLRSPQVRDGERRQGLRGRRQRKAARPEGQGHEVLRRVHESLRSPRQGLPGRLCQARHAQAGCSWT